MDELEPDVRIIQPDGVRAGTGREIVSVCRYDDDGRLIECLSADDRGVVTIPAIGKWTVTTTVDDATWSKMIADRQNPERLDAERTPGLGEEQRNDS